MRSISFNTVALRSTDAANVSAPVTPATPVATPAAKPARKLTVRAAKPAVAKPATVSAKPAAKPAKLVIVKPAAKLAKPAGPAAHITRTAATIAAGACNFGNLSDRDNAYLTFYSRLAKAATAGRVSVSAIVESGKRPNYAGSNKPHDAGVIQRLGKAGLVTIGNDGSSFTFTAKAKTLASYGAGQR